TRQALAWARADTSRTKKDAGAIVRIRGDMAASSARRRPRTITAGPRLRGGRRVRRISGRLVADRAQRLGRHAAPPDRWPGADRRRWRDPIVEGRAQGDPARHPAGPPGRA